MVVIRSTQLHFIRCIKPNEQKAAFVFEPVQVLQQVRRASSARSSPTLALTTRLTNNAQGRAAFYGCCPQLRACGVLETIKISAAGYPARTGFEEFRDRYGYRRANGARY